MALLDFLVVTFLAAGAPIRLAVDDTLFGRSGKHVWGAHYLHDGAQPEGSGRRTRWGNCWVVVVLVVELACLGGRQVGAADPVPAVSTQGRRPPRPPVPARAGPGADRHDPQAVPGPDRGTDHGRRVRDQGVARPARPRDGHDTDAQQRRRVRARAARDRATGTPGAEGRAAGQPGEAGRQRRFQAVTITAPDGRSGSSTSPA